MLHFWVGSFCCVTEKNKPRFPRNVVATYDVIKILEDRGNRIPDKSWMLYLLELFNIKNIPIELNLICQYDDQNYFEAIFQGINRYRFKQVLPKIGNSYARTILMDAKNNIIRYSLANQNSNESEKFDFTLDGFNFNFQSASQFTGIEWWNKMTNSLYHLRYEVEISQLMFGLQDPRDYESIIFVPYSTLVPNNDGSEGNYPVFFSDVILKDQCICYTIQPGICSSGISYNC